jgi:energy-coupling factor transporter ATP-binding protein EcfA2
MPVIDFPSESFWNDTLLLLEREIAPGRLTRLTGLHGSGKTTLLQKWLHQLLERSPESRVFVVTDHTQRAAWRQFAASTTTFPSVHIGNFEHLLWHIFISRPEFCHYATMSSSEDPAPRFPVFGAMFFPSITGVADWHLVDLLRHWSRTFSGELDEALLARNLEMTFPGRGLFSLLVQHEHEATTHLSQGLRTDATTTMALLLQLPPPSTFPFDYVIFDTEHLLTPLELRLLVHWSSSGVSFISTHDPFFRSPCSAWQTHLPLTPESCPNLDLASVPNFFFLRTPRSIADFLNDCYFNPPYPCYNPHDGTQHVLPPSPFIWIREKTGNSLSPLIVASRWLSSLPLLQNLEFLSITTFCSARYLSFFYYLLYYFRQEPHLIPRTVNWLLHLRAIFDDHFSYLQTVSASPGAYYNCFIHDAFSLFHLLFQMYQISTLEQFARLGHLFTFHPLCRITVYPLDERTLPVSPSLVLFGADHLPLQWREDSIFYEQYLHYHALCSVQQTLFLSNGNVTLPFYHPV